jgi:hypothetical protein
MAWSCWYDQIELPMSDYSTSHVIVLALSLAEYHHLASTAKSRTCQAMPNVQLSWTLTRSDGLTLHWQMTAARKRPVSVTSRMPCAKKQIGHGSANAVDPSIKNVEEFELFPLKFLWDFCIIDKDIVLLRTSFYYDYRDTFPHKHGTVLEL